MSFYDLKSNSGFLRTLMIRIASTGEIMVLIAVGEDNQGTIQKLMSAINDRFPEITSLSYVINTKLNDTFADLDIVTFSGRPYIEERMDDLRFRIGPKSFYQTNSEQAHRLYEVARDFADLKGGELVYDLYTGTGTIANFVAKCCRKVIGIEYVLSLIHI